LGLVQSARSLELLAIAGRFIVAGLKGALAAIQLPGDQGQGVNIEAGGLVLRVERLRGLVAGVVRWLRQQLPQRIDDAAPAEAGQFDAAAGVEKDQIGRQHGVGFSQPELAAVHRLGQLNQ